MAAISGFGRDGQAYGLPDEVSGRMMVGMPELPEVETTAVDLAAETIGRRIVEIEKLDHPAMIEGMDSQVFRHMLLGHRIEAVVRRAKWVLIRLDQGLTMAVHLRMTGVLRAVDADEPIDAQTHLVLGLDDGRRIVFRDQRKFGRVRLLDSAGLAELDAAHGIEPLGDDFTVAAFADLMRGRRTRVKALLLDQSLVAGLGNIYVDEALHRAGVHPLRAAESLDAGELSRLHAAIREVLEQAVRRKARYWEGTVRSHDDFDAFAVYDRAGEPCRTCGTPISRILVGQRGTHLCPHCQPGSGR